MVVWPKKLWAQKGGGWGRTWKEGPGQPEVRAREDRRGPGSQGATPWDRLVLGAPSGVLCTTAAGDHWASRPSGANYPEATLALLLMANVHGPPGHMSTPAGLSWTAAGASQRGSWNSGSALLGDTPAVPYRRPGTRSAFKLPASWLSSSFPGQNMRGNHTT